MSNDTWHNISSAPLDGTKIWAYIPAGQGKGTGKYKYITYNTDAKQLVLHWRILTSADTFIASWPKYLRNADGFWVANPTHKIPLPIEPTHWRTLPAPPIV